MKNLKAEHRYTSWRALQIYTVYRIILSGFLLTLFQLKSGEIFLGQLLPNQYNVTSIIYFCSSVGFYFVNYKSTKHFNFLAEFQVFVDLVLIALLMHASGGIATGMGMLMAVSVTTACLLTGRSSSLVFPAIASAIVLGQTIYLSLKNQADGDYITQAGLLGATFFATSLFALITSKRLQQSEREAEITSESLASMEKLNEQIIQFMKTGVVVIDQLHRIQFINTAAWQLLEMPQRIQNQHLKFASKDLDQIVSHWEKTGKINANFQHSLTGPMLQVKLSPIYHEHGQILIFIEDTSQLVQQAQNLKLASLGRLTASIAHEIRNPLGALSHAAQLLEESPDLTQPDKKLTNMVQKNAVRMNTIIENIMQLSQRKASETQNISLKPFIENLVPEIQQNFSEPLDITVNISPENLQVLFDLTQLMQVVVNLAENGIRYSIANTGKAKLSIIAGTSATAQQPFLDIVDKGEGIPPKTAEHIFEPFFTTSNNGTGLGLYISKELCEANRAQLNFIPVPSGGSCFRVTFTREHQ